MIGKLQTLVGVQLIVINFLIVDINVYSNVILLKGMKESIVLNNAKIHLIVGISAKNCAKKGVAHVCIKWKNKFHIVGIM